MARKKAGGADDCSAELEKLMREIHAAFYEVRAAAQKNGILQDWGTSAWGVLQTLDADGPVTMSELARRRSCSRQYIQKIASEPIGKAWIRLEPNPADRRSPLMVITDTGRRRLKGHRRRVDDSLQSLSRHVATEEVTKATATVSMLRRLLAERGIGAPPPEPEED